MAPMQPVNPLNPLLGDTLREYNLTNRDKLLSDIAEGMDNLPANCRLVYTCVAFYRGEEKLVTWYGAVAGLAAVVDDLYWDEAANWKDADRAVVSTY